jgi:hypothetical protein
MMYRRVSARLEGRGMQMRKGGVIFYCLKVNHSRFGVRVYFPLFAYFDYRQVLYCSRRLVANEGMKERNNCIVVSKYVSIRTLLILYHKKSELLS